MRTNTNRRSARLALASAAVLVGSLTTFTTPASAAPVTFDLWAETGATAGTAAMPTMNVMGYSLTDVAGVDAPGGPTLVVNEGDTVTITLHNDLGVPTSLRLAGQSLPTDTVGVTATGSKVYTFTASRSGTFLYEAGPIASNGTNRIGSQYQSAMGLHGALVVRPASAGAYGPDTAFDEEAVLVLSDVDPELNNATDPAAFDMRAFNPTYRLINGHGYPETTLVDTAGNPVTPAANDTVLLRWVNASVRQHSMTVLGLRQTVVGYDGSELDHPHRIAAETFGPGQTADALVTLPAALPFGGIPIYDASLSLRNSNTPGYGGMMVLMESPGVLGPDVVISNVVADPSPNDGTQPFNSTTQAVRVTADAIVGGGETITAAQLFIDTLGPLGSGIPMTPVDASWGGTSEAVYTDIPLTTIAALSEGTHTLYVVGRNGAQVWGAPEIGTLERVAAPYDLVFSTQGNGAIAGIGGPYDSADIYALQGTTYTKLADAVSDLLLPAAGATGAQAQRAATAVDGIDWVGPDHVYLSFTTDGVVVGGLTINEEDVVEYDNGTWTMVFDGSAEGLNAAADIDAISVGSGGTLYFSTLANQAVVTGDGGAAGRRSDIYSWDGTNFAKVVDASTVGVPDDVAGHNVDGLTVVSANDFYLSFVNDITLTNADTSTLTVQDEDVVHYLNGTWAIYYDGTAAGLTAAAQDVAAFDVP